MRKMELVQLHALLAEVRRELAVTHDVPPETFREYETHGVGPSQIQCGKGDHKRAIGLLQLGIMRVLAEEKPMSRSRQTPTP